MKKDLEMYLYQLRIEADVEVVEMVSLGCLFCLFVLCFLINNSNY